MITTEEYYRNYTDIPNIEDVSPTSNLTGNNVLLNSIIQIEEPKILVDLLGYSLYNEFISQFDTNVTPWVLNIGVDQKWEDLLNGKTYTLNGKDVHYKGLIFTEGTQKISPLANWVYCKFIKNDVTKYLSVGVKSLKAKNANDAMANSKYVESFRQFHEMTQYENGNYCTEYNNGIRSLYQFIQDSNNEVPNTYNNWSPKHFENVNSFGL